MKWLKAWAAVTAMAVPASSAVDPSDVVLYAYELSGVGAGDGQISDVWSSWDGKDYADLTIEDKGAQLGTVPWSGPDDARMVIKAAYDDDGLYLYLEVSDNSYVEAQEGYQFDKVDIYVDNQSSDDIYNADPFEVFCYPTWWQMTYTCMQFQVAFGGASAPTTFTLNHYDETMWEMTYNEISMDEAKSTMDGLCFDIVDVDGTTKAQEWFIPWSQVGIGGTGGKPAQGTRLAFGGGYNDVDADNPEGESVNIVAFRNRHYPFASPDSDPAWGDLQIGEGDPIGVVHPSADRTPAAVGVARTEYYTVSGQKLARFTPARLASHGLVVRRDILADGSIRSRVIRSAR